MSLKRKNIQMNVEDYLEYYEPAFNNLFPRTKTVTLVTTMFDTALGVSFGREFLARSDSLDGPLPDDWREFLLQLAGPYGKSILKAYQIRHRKMKVEDEQQDRTVLQAAGEGA